MRNPYSVYHGAWHSPSYLCFLGLCFVFSTQGWRAGGGSVCISLPCTLGWNSLRGPQDSPCLFALSQDHRHVLLVSTVSYILSGYFTLLCRMTNLVQCYAVSARSRVTRLNKCQQRTFRNSVSACHLSPTRVISAKRVSIQHGPVAHERHRSVTTLLRRSCGNIAPL